MSNEPTEPLQSDDPRPEEHLHLHEGEEAPPRGVRVMAVVRWAILLLAAAAAVSTIWSYFHEGQASAHSAAAKFSCPMHPRITSDVPGECPICQMTLEPIPEDRQKANAPAAKDAPTPAPMKAPASPSSPAAPAPAMGQPRIPAAPPNAAPLNLSLDRVQAIGVRTSVVAARPVNAGLRVTASVAAPEQGAASVHTRVSGYVERISVQETGVHVGKGQELVAIYSPEIYQAETELIASRGWAGGEAEAGAPSAAMQKLELLGMSKAAIDRVLSDGKPARAVSITSPADGYVAKKNVVLGSFVTPEMDLYEIVDLSRVYVLADVSQRDIGRITVGTTGRFWVSSRPNEAVEAKVDLIYPTLNAEARTTRVRMQVRNPKLVFRPGEYGLVEFAGPLRTAIAVPRDAVIDTGAYTYVFIDEGGGKFTPRGVTLGTSLDDMIEIAAGLNSGDRVVSGATFLIDSESRLQGSLSQPAGAPTPASTNSACDAQIDRAKYGDKYIECQKCEIVHRGMGTMADDCKNTIPKPWK